MTKGEAANIISRLKHGAQVSTYSSNIVPPTLIIQYLQSRYEKKAKQARKAALLVAKEQSRRAREPVQVGPLAA